MFFLDTRVSISHGTCQSHAHLSLHRLCHYLQRHAVACRARLACHEEVHQKLAWVRRREEPVPHHGCLLLEGVGENHLAQEEAHRSAEGTVVAPHKVLARRNPVEGMHEEAGSTPPVGSTQHLRGKGIHTASSVITSPRSGKARRQKERTGKVPMHT